MVQLFLAILLLFLALVACYFIAQPLLLGISSGADDLTIGRDVRKADIERTSLLRELDELERDFSEGRIEEADYLVSKREVALRLGSFLES